MLFRTFFLIGLLLGLVGCVSNPPTSVHQPMTAKPVDRKVVASADGAIFHAGINERPLFEDKRARNVGDILTINIVEKNTGNKKSSGSSSTANSINATTPSVTVGTPARMLLKAFAATSSSSNKATTTGAGTASEDMTGTITVGSEEHTSELQSPKDLVCRLL